MGFTEWATDAFSLGSADPGVLVRWAIPSLASFFSLIFFFNVYLFLRQRERQSMNGGGAEREGDRDRA